MNKWMKRFGYLLGGLSLMFPIGLIILAIPFVNYLALTIIGFITELCWLFSMIIITKDLEIENRTLKSRLNIQEK